LKEDLDH